MFDRFRQLADEATGIPSYSHGNTGVQGMTRTASGMSMLMGAASLNIKTVVKNLDDFLLKPLGKAFYQWNMQFYEGELNVTGDLEVKATGTSSLMQKEVRSQRLTTFLQSVQSFRTKRCAKLMLSVLAIKNDGTPISINLEMVPHDELVCIVDKTRCPVWAALIATLAVSASRISPIIIVSGS